MTASGNYGAVRACAGIVGPVDLRLGADVEDVLRSHIAAGHGRFRGVRQSAAYNGDPNVLGPLHGGVPGGLYQIMLEARPTPPGWRQTSPSSASFLTSCRTVCTVTPNVLASFSWVT